MDYVSSWGDSAVASSQNLLNQFGTFLLALVGAFAFLIIGLILASAAGKVVSKLIQVTKLDELLEKMGIGEVLKKFGLHFTLSSVVGWLAKWFVLIAVLIAIADNLGWTQVTDFLQKVALYIPNVIVAVIILVIGLVAGHFIEELVKKALKATDLSQANAGLLAVISKWSVVVFASMATLIQLGIAEELIETLFTGIIAMVAIAGGIAFGLGGKEKASEIIDKLTKHIEKKKK